MMWRDTSFCRRNRSLIVRSAELIFIETVIWLFSVSEADQPPLWSIHTLIKSCKVTEVTERLFCWRLRILEGRGGKNSLSFYSSVALLIAHSYHCQEDVSGKNLILPQFFWVACWLRENTNKMKVMCNPLCSEVFSIYSFLCLYFHGLLCFFQVNWRPGRSVNL